MVYTLYCLRYRVTTTMLQREFKQLRELAFTARAVCCSLSTTDGLTFAPAKPTSFLGCLTDFTLRRRQPCRLATPKGTRATLPPETADGWVTSLRC